MVYIQGGNLMNRSEVISILNERTSIPKKDIEKIIEGFSLLVGETLQTGEKVVITGLGTFEVRKRVGRQGRNPRTGQQITIPPIKTPAFIAGKSLKDFLRQ